MRKKQRRERVGVHLRAAEDGGKLLESAPTVSSQSWAYSAASAARPSARRLSASASSRCARCSRSRKSASAMACASAVEAALLGTQQAQGPGCALAQVVDIIQAGGGFVRVRRAVAVRVLLPRGRARPRAAADGPEQDVVFERVRLLRREPGEARAQVGRDVLGVPPAGHDVVGRADERHERLFAAGRCGGRNRAVRRSRRTCARVRARSRKKPRTAMAMSRQRQPDCTSCSARAAAHAHSAARSSAVWTVIVCAGSSKCAEV